MRNCKINQVALSRMAILTLHSFLSLALLNKWTASLMKRLHHLMKVFLGMINYSIINKIILLIDILKLRTPTISASSQVFEIDGTKLHIFDVSGFSYSRNSWLVFFEDVTCVLFVASLSSYDQVMAEETDVNRMVDSIVLFQDLANTKTLEKKPFILFLNKKDIYDRKIKTRNIVDYFPGYKGAPGDSAQGIKYFESKFKDPNIVSKPVTTHITCCTDTEFMKVILWTVVKTVLDGRLKEAGFAL